MTGHFGISAIKTTDIPRWPSVNPLRHFRRAIPVSRRSQPARAFKSPRWAWIRSDRISVSPFAAEVAGFIKPFNITRLVEPRAPPCRVPGWR